MNELGGTEVRQAMLDMLKIGRYSYSYCVKAEEMSWTVVA